MPIYQNYRARSITIFLQNSVPVKFLPGEHKVLAQEGLEKQYGTYLRRTDVVKEGTEVEKKPKQEKGLINEVKQPEPNKELMKEPVEESTKKGRKVIKEGPKVKEGYNPGFLGEQTIAGTSRQGNE
jgi:hypothetical protein